MASLSSPSSVLGEGHPSRQSRRAPFLIIYKSHTITTTTTTATTTTATTSSSGSGVSGGSYTSAAIDPLARVLWGGGGYWSYNATCVIK